MKHPTTEFRLQNAYGTYIDTVGDLFDKTGEGFFVPLYQREYTWESDNVDQLFDDLFLGILELTGADGETATTFLGTTIFVPLFRKDQTVRQGEERAQPSEVLLVIDGQQRISTLALLAIRLHARVQLLKDRLPNGEPYATFHDHSADTIASLRKLYTVEPGRGAFPRHKPKVIRANDDRWTHRGDDTSYCSPVASYIAKYIRASVNDAASDCMPDDPGRVKTNVLAIDRWLDHVVQAHLPTDDLHGQFPTGSSIASDRVQRDVLGFSSSEVTTPGNQAGARSKRTSLFCSRIVLLVCPKLLSSSAMRSQPAVCPARGLGV